MTMVLVKVSIVGVKCDAGRRPGPPARLLDLIVPVGDRFRHDVVPLLQIETHRIYTQCLARLNAEPAARYVNTRTPEKASDAAAQNRRSLSRRGEEPSS